MFVGSVSGFISAFSSIVIRSMLSKCVSKAELGKIFSLLASLEAAVPLFAAPLFTFVYTNTLETWTGERTHTFKILTHILNLIPLQVLFLLSRLEYFFLQVVAFCSCTWPYLEMAIRVSQNLSMKRKFFSQILSEIYWEKKLLNIVISHDFVCCLHIYTFGMLFNEIWNILKSR